MDQQTPRLKPNADKGLSGEQVLRQVQRGLINVRPKGAEKSVWEIIRDNTFTLFNLFNAGVAACVFWVGAYRNLLFMALVVVNTLVAIVQEIRTRRLVAKLNVLTMPRAHVVRDGNVVEIAVEQLVLDDIVLLETGYQVAADCIVQQGEVEVNEALLTGEADPIIKRSGDLLLSGSFVVSGRCHAKVEHLGSQNYAVSIEQDAKVHKRVRSKLMGALNQVVKFTGVFIVPLGVLLMLRSLLFLHLSVHDAVTTTAAAMLGMMPAGLILLTSLSLMVGVYKLAKAKTLVHELFGIEALSRVDMLCIDKTGTLTEGNMRVIDWIPLPGTDAREAERLIGNYLYAQTDSNATVEAVRKRFQAVPAKADHVVPFSSQRKWSAVSFADGTVFMGAPDILWPKGRALPESIRYWESEGARVLLFAHSSEKADRALPDTIIPMAAVALRDPLRNDAAEILGFFHKEGVAIKIISGDHPNLLVSIAKKAGLEDAENAIDMKGITDAAQIRDAARRYAIFGRVSPHQKRELVRSLQQAGHTVAMMGDGVNDVLALREADCSVTFASGTEAARSISQIVLLDNDFASLPRVVMEGRRVVNNIRRTASLYLAKTVYSFGIAIFTVISAIRYPFIPIQLTLIGALMEGIPSFFLAIEPNDSPIDDRFFEAILQKTLPTGLVIVSLVMGIHALMGPMGLNHLQARTLCVYCTGAFCAALLYAVSRPLNRMRLLLWLCMTLLFVLCVCFFPAFLMLSQPTWLLAMLSGIFIVAGDGLLWLYTGIVKKALAGYYNRRSTLQ